MNLLPFSTHANNGINFFHIHKSDKYYKDATNEEYNELLDIIFENKKIFMEVRFKDNRGYRDLRCNGVPYGAFELKKIISTPH